MVSRLDVKGSVISSVKTNFGKINEFRFLPINNSGKEIPLENVCGISIYLKAERLKDDNSDEWDKMLDYVSQWDAPIINSKSPLAFKLIENCKQILFIKNKKAKVHLILNI
jgi:hypothetical protein